MKQKTAIEKQACEEFFKWNDGLSDMDYSYNPETKEFDIPAIEWDGMYGSHWVRYANEEARDRALKQYKAEMDIFVNEYVNAHNRENELLLKSKVLPNSATFTLGEIFQRKM